MVDQVRNARYDGKKMYDVTVEALETTDKDRKAEKETVLKRWRRQRK